VVPGVGHDEPISTMVVASRLIGATSSADPWRPRFVFGAGVRSLPVLASLGAAGWVPNGIFDNDRRKWGTRVAGVRVHPPVYHPDGLVVVASLTHAAEMRAQLRAMGYRPDQVRSLVEPPVELSFAVASEPQLGAA
jgi:hypothetical protein